MKSVYSDVEAARRYDSARCLPSETTRLWLKAITSSIPGKTIESILDLGCGTGRFTAALGEAFGCPTVGVEPSSAMLDVAISRNEPNVEWKQGQAESIPMENEAFDLVFMSQVFHHLAQPRQAFQEIARVLTPSGYLAIRNGTREHNGELPWLKFFPEAARIENQRTPLSQELNELVCDRSAGSFVMISHQTINQLFASSYAEYFEKIGRRGLSALIAISDEDFKQGLRRFKAWVKSQPNDTAVYEPVDLFLFQKRVD